MQTLGSEARREQVNHVCENAVQCLGRQSSSKASRSSRCTRSLHLISRALSMHCGKAGVRMKHTVGRWTGCRRCR